MQAAIAGRVFVLLFEFLGFGGFHGCFSEPYIRKTRCRKRFEAEA
jgi:hypothetical protein